MSCIRSASYRHGCIASGLRLLCTRMTSPPIRRHELLRKWNSTTSYTDSILMPKTTFPTRTNDKLVAEKFLKVASDDVYAWQKSELPEEKLFILHDGPPYANADVHLGHAVNRIVKDMILRYQILRGRRVSFIPGWDCHGLPIELKVLDSVAKGKDGKRKVAAMTATEIRSLARQHADNTITKQMANFREWATLGEWGTPYKTMDPDYEIRQLGVFKAMLKAGLIYRRDRPVYWSCESHTALAEAELEYSNSHVSSTVYVKFPLIDSSSIDQLLSKPLAKPIHALIWTTTPWTIPSNKAIAVGPTMTYCVVRHDTHGYLLVAESRVEDLMKELGKLEVIQSEIQGEVLTSCTYTHPLFATKETQPIFSAPFVTADSGTGLVHLAPGHGMDDYLVCQTNGIPPYSPVDNYGKYDDNLPEELKSLVGKHVLKAGQESVIGMLEDATALAGVNRKYCHKYPYDWRSKKPVIIRSTSQWFANVGSIKDLALESLNNVNFVPDAGSHRLSSFVRDRSEWCISRQRSWGVPIPALYDAETNEALLTDASVTHIIEQIKQHGIDKWFEDEEDISHWVANEYRQDGKTYVKGKDTMDVWFDSGSSWTLIEEKFGARRNDKPALVDVYMEGSDQHRGWFQSSLLTYVASMQNGRAPYAAVITHGFTLDEVGKKMSKSLGNVVLPSMITSTGYKNTPAIGVNGLRLWVAQAEYTTDIGVSAVVLQRVADSLSKLRRTFRYILGNINDFDGEYVPYNELRATDKYALYELFELERQVTGFYDQFQFNRVIHSVNKHVASLSASYLNTSKDRLYTDYATSLSRRSVQTVLANILRVYLSIVSPIVPLLTQEAWYYSPSWFKFNDDSKYFSPFVAGWYTAPDEWNNKEICADFKRLDAMETTVKSALAVARNSKAIGSSLDANVILSASVSSPDFALLKKYEPDLAELFVTSSAKVYAITEVPTALETRKWSYIPGTDDSAAHAKSTIGVHVVNPDMHKCSRCWQHNAPAEDGLCARCDDVMAEYGK
ncbi:tRNA synthetases class I-domain-containing protein [Limtongia smithiae]|uniref:tRNA synthetases class I-domain-containing protein n=1 Tax=Limtongia smithiae TaxID=1125753 RepID=UPI0034CF5B22